MIAVWLDRHSPDTLAGYAGDLKAYAGDGDPQDAIAELLAGGHGNANLTALDYRNLMIADGLAPNTINRRLATLRSVLSACRMAGLISWELEVPNVPASRKMVVEAPTAEQIRAILSAAGSRSPHPAINTRDVAILSLAVVLGLRRVELHRLNVQDLDLTRRTLAVRGKGKLEAQDLHLPEEIIPALREWLEVRRHHARDEALFTSFNSNARHHGHRLARRSYNWIASWVSAESGIDFRPHDLRRASLNLAAEATDHNAAKVQVHGRHARFDTTRRYLSSLGEREVGREVVGEVARRLNPL